MNDNKEISVLYFNTRDELIRVDLRKVGFFKADRNYTDVYFLNNHRVTLPTNLMSIEKMLDDDRMRGRTIPFVRIGRSVMKTIVTPNTYIAPSGTTPLKVADLLPLAAASPAPQQAPSFAPRQAPSSPPRPVQKPSTPTYSIAHLEAVWEDYHETLLDIQRRQRTTTLLRSASPMFTLGSGALAALAKVIDKDGDAFFYVALALMAIGFILMFFSFFKGLSDNSIDEKEEATELFNSYYVCPNPKCHHFMGNQAYQIVSQHKNCPWCKCKFTTSK